ncbi:hypothetical protein SPBR_01443 [Sporothrix brasiliensis 5110]|uniref:DUF7357 domain-containing protein n=1 Tax=Sporothrix brasiliensis 5110 TaxID=1398154 RepID=A0A0C2EX91_9PEZI|nr:uncharacterized protein SPBR_01443 [Sporothrix brasiliensis 5110]KIH91199.1 hypothetical protein SPBR_01443 [Sporothrix brasiliensis 5110]
MIDRPLRLRLHIQRNGLPDTRVVFLLAATDDTTVTKLLEQVNETVPLESTDWGLDDYVVELQSTTSASRFECLHYQLVAKLFDRDDEVFIRPLSSDDLKIRRMGGRHQISSDGRRLVDGVPFGRPLLKRPHRPPVEIAPRKRRRPLGSGIPDDGEQQEDEDEEDEEDERGKQLVRYISNEEHSGTSSSEDEDDVDEELDEELDKDELQNLRDDVAQAPRRVHFATRDTTNGADDDSSDDDDDDDDFEDAGSGSDSSDSSDSSDDSGDDKPPEISSKQSAANIVAPHQGKARTKKRNARRRAKRALDKIKAQEASGTAVLAEPAEPATGRLAETTSSTETPSPLARRLRLDMSAGQRLIASALGLRGGKAAPKPTTEVLLSSPSTGKATVKENEKEQGNEKAPPRTLPEGHPDHWASRINYTAVECSDENFALDAPTFPFVQQWHGNTKNNGKAKKGQKGQQQHVNAGTKRKQVSVAAAADEPRPKKRAAPAAESDTSSDASDSDDDSDDDSDGSFQDDSGSSSSSSSSDGDSDDDEQNEEAGVETSEETVVAEDEELPPLPADITSLPPLQLGDAVEGMIVTWKNWVLSEKTNWQPQVADVTGKVVGVDADGTKLRVVLARRDRDLDRKPEKQYDEETGERVYGRFDGPDMEDEGDDRGGEHDEEAQEADTGHRSLVLADMLEPRILQAAAAATVTAADV